MTGMNKRFLKGERVSVRGTVLQACTTGSTYRPGSGAANVLRVTLDGTKHELYLPLYLIRPLPATADEQRQLSHPRLRGESYPGGLRFSLRGVVLENQEKSDPHSPPGKVSVRFDDGQSDEILSWAVRRVRIKEKAAKSTAKTA